MHRTNLLFSIFVASACLLSPLTAAAQERSTGFRFGFGWHDLGGDVGASLDGAVDAEFTVLVPVSFLRVGAGASWASFDVDGAEASWSQVRFHTLVGVPFRLSERVHPYVEGRWTFRHLRPEDDRYFGGEDKLLRDFKSTGHGLEAVGGVALFITPRVAVDLSAAVGSFGISPDLSDQGLGSVDSGVSRRFHVGLTWHPTHGRAVGS